MKKIIVSLLLVFVLVAGLCLTSCSENVGKELIKTAQADYAEYNKEVIENVIDAMADSYAPLSIAKDSLEDGKTSLTVDIGEGELVIIDFFTKDGKYAATISHPSTNESGSIYYADKNVTVDFTGIEEAGMDKAFTFALDIFKGTADTQPEEYEELQEALNMLKGMFKFDITSEEEIKKFVDKLEGCVERTIEEKDVTIETKKDDKKVEKKIDSIVTTETIDKETFMKVLENLWNAIDFDAVSRIAGEMDEGESIEIPSFNEIKEQLGDLFDINATEVYAVSMDKGLPVLYTCDGSFSIDASAIIPDADIPKLDLNISIKVQFPENMSVYNRSEASVTISGSLLNMLLDSEEDGDISASIVWEPEDSKDEFTGTLKLKLKAAGMTISPLSATIERSKKTGDFTVTVKAGLLDQMAKIELNGNIKSEKNKTTVKLISAAVDEETEELNAVLTFEKGCEFPSIPAAEKIGSLEDLEKVLPEELFRGSAEEEPYVDFE